jgi:hypothetical protein
VRCRALHSVPVLTGALLLGAVGAALAPAGPDALVPFKLLAASAARDVSMAVVVDFGNGAKPTTVCLHVPEGTTDVAALQDVYTVEENDSGLLCDIDGQPSSDTSQCLKTGTNGTFYYWSYWHGASSGGWQYADDNFNTYTVTDGEVEGWRYQDPGADNSSATPPSASGSYDSLCGSVPTTVVTPTTSAQVPTTTATSPAGGGTVTTVGKGDAPDSGHSATTTPAVTGSHASATSTPTSSAQRTTPAGRSQSGHPGRPEAALAPAPDRAAGAAGTTGPPLLPIVLVGAAIAVLAALSYFRWRRRPAEE